MSKIAFENRSAQAEAKRQFEAGKDSINGVINQWNLLDVGQLNDELLNELIRSTDVGSIVKRGLIASFQESDLKIAGRQVTRETMAGMIQPFDLTGLQAAVAEAASHFGVFDVGSMIGGKFQLDPAKAEDLKRRHTVMTDDNKTLNAVNGIIDNLKILFDSGKLIPEHTLHHLVKAKIVDYYPADGIQPARSLFIKNN